MIAFLDRLKSKQTARILTQREEWLSLVSAVADGREPPEDDVLAILQRVGRTVADLEAAAALVSNRRRLADQVAQVPGAKAEVQKIEAAAELAAQELRAAEDKYNSAVAKLRDLRATHDQTIADGNAALAELGQTWTCPQIRDALAANLEATKPLDARLRILQEQRGGVWYDVQQNTPDAPPQRELSERHRQILRDQEPKQTDPEQLKRAQAQLDRIDGEIAAVKNELGKLQQESDALREKALDPLAIA